jgi:hypothetical protein
MDLCCSSASSTSGSSPYRKNPTPLHLSYGVVYDSITKALRSEETQRAAGVRHRGATAGLLAGGHLPSRYGQIAGLQTPGLPADSSFKRQSSSDPTPAVTASRHGAESGPATVTQHPRRPPRRDNPPGKETARATLEYRCGRLAGQRGRISGPERAVQLLPPTRPSPAWRFSPCGSARKLQSAGPSGRNS